MLNLTIDGIPVRVEEGATVLEAARRAGVWIPTLCFLKGRSAAGSCRVCVVEVEGEPGLVAACNTPAREGMAVFTATPRVEQARRTALQLVLAEHGLDSTDYCFSCVKNGACELQAVCRACGVGATPFSASKPARPRQDANPFLSFDPKLCIACQRCVGTCNAAVGNRTLHAAKQGPRTVIEAPFGEGWRTSGCESCGNCAQACPTGALTVKRRRSYSPWEVERVRTTCPHCATGCQVDLVVKGGRIVDAEGADGPSNGGLLCVKGRSGSFDFVHAPDRLTAPLVRNPATGELEETSWDEALSVVARELGRIRDEHGGAALAAFACSRSTNEDVYLFQKMARTALHTHNVDNCARV